MGFQDRLSLNAGQQYCRMLQKSILQYFRSSLSFHLSLRPLFCLLFSGRLRRVLLYVFFGWLYILIICFKIITCLVLGITMIVAMTKSVFGAMRATLLENALYCNLIHLGHLIIYPRLDIHYLHTR